MRILLVSHSPNNPNAGASRVYHLLTEGLRERGHVVRCLHFEDLQIPKRFSLPAKRLMIPRFAAKAVRGVVEEGFDVLMCSNGILYPLYRELRSKKVRPLLVQHYHGLSLFDHQAILTEALRGHIRPSLVYRTVTGHLPSFWDREGARYSDQIIVQNDRDADAIEEQTSAPVHRVPLALHASLAAAGSQAPPMNRRRSHGLVWFGSWSERKGCSYIPGALRRVFEKYPEVSLTIGGTDKGERLKNSFASELRDRITVLPHISVEEQIALFGQNSIFLFPSISEGFGFALLEAMGMGMACVTTQTGIGGDYLRDRETALIIPSSSSLHLSHAISELLRDGGLRERLSLNGQALAQQFTTERMISGYEQIFQSGLKDRGTA